MNPIVAGEALVKRYRSGTGGSLVAVDHVDVSVIPGTCVGVVGESGSGKTTLAEMLAGLCAPTQGRVLYDGRDLRALDRAGRRAYRRDVQFVFQDPLASMNPTFTVERVLDDPQRVLLGHRSKEERLARSSEMLERVGLSRTLLRAYPSELSGGQGQRVAIARALVVEPKVVICDECTSALDVSVQAQILNLLRDLQSMWGLSLLLVSHDMGVVSYLADTVVVMHDGRAVEMGPAERVVNRPREDYTKLLLGSAEAIWR